MNMSREGTAVVVFFAGANSIFAGDKLLTTPNPDIKEDIQMLEILGMRVQKPFEKHPQPITVEAVDSKIPALGEKPKWSRPSKQKAKIK